MGSITGIEWTGSTWNPIRARVINPDGSRGKLGYHCEHVSEACRWCYAEKFNNWIGTHHDYKPDELNGGRVEVFLDREILKQPLRWTRARKIFPCSMTDLFGRFVTDEMLDEVFAIMARCPQHTFQPLTKRPERACAYLTSRLPKPLPNVWMGTTTENDVEYHRRWPHLAATPAYRRFVSCEPVLGPIGNLAFGGFGLPDWVICGGESGPHARPMQPAWAEALRDQCAVAGIPFFFKQWGEWAPHGPNHMQRVGKKRAGSLLDGREHKAFPK